MSAIVGCSKIPDTALRRRVQKHFTIHEINCYPSKASGTALFSGCDCQSQPNFRAKYTLCSSARDSIFVSTGKGSHNINITLRDRVLARARNSDRAWLDDGDATQGYFLDKRFQINVSSLFLKVQILLRIEIRRK